MTQTLYDFMPAVEAAKPDDPQPLLVAADWCDENGKARLAYALKWCAGKGKRPFRRTDVQRRPWLWYCHSRALETALGKRTFRARGAAILSGVFHDVMKAPIGPRWVDFPTLAEAYQWLGEGLAILRQLIEVPQIIIPPQPQVVRLGPVTCAKCGALRGREFLECFACKSTEVL